MPPVRANHAIAMERQARRSPTQHHKRSPANSRTPSPNLEKQLSKRPLKSPRSAFNEPKAAVRRRSPVLQAPKKAEKKPVRKPSIDDCDAELETILKSKKGASAGPRPRSEPQRASPQKIHRPSRRPAKDALRASLQRVLDQESPTVRDIEELQALLDSRKQQLLAPLSKTPELDAEVSRALADASDGSPDDTATAKIERDEHPEPLVFFTRKDSRLERLQRLHATAKAPTDQMFSSAYAQRLATAKKNPPVSKRKDVDPRSTLSSPETVISSVSDYTAWSCPSPRSPNHVEFSYQPPPSFVPRIRLEALRSPRRCDAVHSPDPNKSVSTLHSPCSAFTPRSSASDDHHLLKPPPRNNSTTNSAYPRLRASAALHAVAAAAASGGGAQHPASNSAAAAAAAAKPPAPKPPPPMEGSFSSL